MDEVVAVQGRKVGTRTAPAGYMTRQQVADYLSVNRNTVSKWVKEGLWPPPEAQFSCGLFWTRATVKQAAWDVFGLNMGIDNVEASV